MINVILTLITLRVLSELNCNLYLPSQGAQVVVVVAVVVVLLAVEVVVVVLVAVEVVVVFAVASTPRGPVAPWIPRGPGKPA